MHVDEIYHLAQQVHGLLSSGSHVVRDSWVSVM